jgi:hypothetical protein
MTETWSVSPSVDMLPFGVTVPATVPQGSEIPEGLTNNPVVCFTCEGLSRDILMFFDLLNKMGCIMLQNKTDGTYSNHCILKG